MSAMETTFTVRTDTDNDAMQVPDGIETVVVNDSAERVFVPPGVQIIRLQTAGGGGGKGGGGHVRSRSPDSPDKYGDMIDELVRAKRSAAARVTHAPAMAEKSLSLPSCPPTPPGSRSAGTDAPDFCATEKLPPVAETAAGPFTASPAETASPPSAPAEEAHSRDIFDDRTLEVDRKRVINQQPTAAAVVAVVAGHTAVGNGRVVRYAGETEGEMRDPLVSHNSAKMRKLDSFGWREEFESGEKEQKPTVQLFGRAVADVLCCWLGV